MKFCSCIADKKKRARAIRELLRKDGDKVPESDIRKVTPSTLDEWVVKCDCDGNLVGAMRTKKTDWYLWTIKNGVVKKGLQGHGIGTKLLKEVVEKSIDQGAKVLAADITFDNVKSQRMAKSRGFKKVSKFCWNKGDKPANILHYVLYPPTGNKCIRP